MKKYYVMYRPSNIPLWILDENKIVIWHSAGPSREYGKKVTEKSVKNFYKEIDYFEVLAIIDRKIE